MQIGMVGLGRMGANLARRLSRAGHSCVVHDRSEAAMRALADEGFARRPQASPTSWRSSPRRAASG